MFNNATYESYSPKSEIRRFLGRLKVEDPPFFWRTQSLKDESIRTALLSATGPNAPEASSAGYGSAGRPSNRPLCVVIAGGGTGGHLFPGIAVAQEFQNRNPASKITFVSTGNLLEKTVLSKTGYTLQTITAAGIKGLGVWNQVKSVAKIPGGILAANKILKNISPDLTIGLGSYSAGPVVFAAWLQRIPIVVQEQNILPGITNRILSRFADRVYISFKNTRSHMDPQKVYWTGNPVRREILDSDDSFEAIKDKASDVRAFTVLILGGSQGAHTINMAVIEALDHLGDTEQLHFVHQTGQADEKPVREAYSKSKISGRVQAFFDDMATQYGQADLIICRAGATTVAEVTALGKAVIFIPFPFAADNHQVLNAGSLSDEGAAEMLLEKDLNGRILSEKIKYYAAHPAELEKMSSRAKQFGKPDAARNIVDDCYRLLAR
jgi:UDP-N-acetylglucosamine--N-acetylmuramyl-(pentapeptide) pyrophosphoryl-undecaprenol N-acetylglucosamine transferase